jgi:hypothetical protein
VTTLEESLAIVYVSKVDDVHEAAFPLWKMWKRWKRWKIGAAGWKVERTD